MGLHLIPKFVNLYQGQVDIRCEDVYKRQAQSLYEKKVMSYPRTGSRYIPEDVFDEMPERVAMLGQLSLIHISV